MKHRIILFQEKSFFCIQNQNVFYFLSNKPDSEKLLHQFHSFTCHCSWCSPNSLRGWASLNVYKAAGETAAATLHRPAHAVKVFQLKRQHYHPGLSSTEKEEEKKSLSLTKADVSLCLFKGKSWRQRRNRKCLPHFDDRWAARLKASTQSEGRISSNESKFV